MIRGYWEPQDETEEQLLEDIHIVTRLAAVEGMCKSRISSLLAFMGSAAAQQAAFEESPQDGSESLRDEMGEGPPDELVCPECGESVEGVDSEGIGEDIVIDPCGHEATEEVVKEMMFR